MSKEKTYLRECQQSLTLQRDGKRIELTTGQKFEFNQAEYDNIMKSAPNAVSAKGTVDLDSGDVDLKKLETEQVGNQVNAPAGTVDGDPEAKPGKKASKKAAEPEEDEL